MKRAIYLHGLNCAHCAGKIERDVQKISYLSNVSLNFPTKKLTYDSEESQKRCLSEITKIVKSHEPDVVVSIDKEQKETNKKVFFARDFDNSYSCRNTWCGGIFGGNTDTEYGADDCIIFACRL